MDIKLRHNPNETDWRTTADQVDRRTLLECAETELIERGTLLHAAGSMTNADTYLVHEGGRALVLKTFRNRRWLIRLLLTRKALRHEYEAMRQLQDLPGVPRVYGYVGDDSMLMEYIGGAGPLRDSRELAAEAYPPKVFFKRLKALLEGMHHRGVSHGDIRRRNIMRDANEQPYLIDFATAVNRRGRFGWLRRHLFAMLRKADRFALAKLTATYYPELLSADDRARLHDLPWYLKSGRFLRKKVYRRFIKQKRWRERWMKLKVQRSEARGNR